MRGFAITAQGAQLLTKVAGGAGTLQITAVKVGKGLPEGDPSLLTDLVSPVALGSCTVPKVENNRMSMVVEYRNDMDGGLKEDFMLSEFGIFAKVKELEEDAVLLYIGVLGDNPGVVSAWNGNNLESRRYPVSIVVSKDLQVEINFPAGAFITSDEFDEAMETHNKSISSHSDIRAMATETYNPETTYTAGAYCIHDGKLYKAQADISAPEEWTESHWTLTSVGAELQELEAALSNKVNKYTRGVEFPPQTVHEILDMEPGVYSWIQESPLGWEPKDTPSGLLRVEFSKQHGEGTALTYNLAYTDGATNLRRYFGESGPDATIRWGRIPVATPPQRYVLQLADGWVRVNAAEYWRTQEGLVIVTFRIARSGGAEISAAPHPIATLPEGYKPVGYAAHVAASTMTAVPAVVWVGDDGVIYASAAQDIPGSSDPAPGNWPGFVATMVFCAN